MNWRKPPDFRKVPDRRGGASDVPGEIRQQLGPIENWRWCLQHLRCCFVFGWLVCRGPRTFRAWTYYLYEYWRCVRETVGKAVASPPTAAERRDFHSLVEALAVAFKPYLTDQLASVEYPAGIPEKSWLERSLLLKGRRMSAISLSAF